MNARIDGVRRDEKRPLGNSGIEISPFVLGGNVFGWTADKATSNAILDRFADAGFETIDTADVYSSWVPGNRGGESEEIIGDWMKTRGRRDRTIVITKVGWDLGAGKKGLSAGYIRRGRRGVAATAPDRLHRRLHVAPARPVGAVRGDAGRV